MKLRFTLFNHIENNFIVRSIKKPKIGREMQDPSAGPSFEVMKETLAYKFFGHKIFYNGDQRLADFDANNRVKAFYEKTAWDILKGADDFHELMHLLSRTCISATTVEPYWEHVRSKPEDRLDGRRYALNMARYLLDMTYFSDASNHKMRHHENTGDDSMRKRGEDIHIVLGSSGSGKTAFAWKHLACPSEIQKLVNNGKGCCSFYFQACLGFSLNDTIQQIKKRIVSETDGKYDGNTSERLDINLALVIDEAAHLEGKLDTMKALREAVNKLKDTLVKGHVRLILAGTGYDVMVDNISSEVDVFKYDMRPWSQDKINFYVRNSEEFRHEEKESVIRCMNKYQILSKLASNARMATILLTRDKLDDFQYLVERHVSSLVVRLIDKCVRSYIGQNRLRQFNGFEQKLVARVVFGQLDALFKDEGSLKIPTFDHASLPEDCRASVTWAARSLVEQNYEVGSGSNSILDESQPAIYVSPAITIVLFIMLGVTPTALAGWQLLEMIGALTLLKKAVTRPIVEWTAKTQKDFQKMMLDVLHTPVPAPRTQNEFSIPSRLRSCIWINGPLAPFGDYFSASDKVIGQAKYVGRDSTIVELDLFDECLETGLVKSDVVEKNDQETYLLGLALLHVLSTQAESDRDEEDTLQLEPEAINIVPEDHEYPQALFLDERQAPVGLVDCHVDSMKRTVSLGSHPPIIIDDEKALKDWQLHFFTNGKSFQILCCQDNASEMQSIIIDRSKVNFDGEVIQETEKKVLELWMKEKLREGVVLRFFFARKY